MNKSQMIIHEAIVHAMNYRLKQLKASEKDSAAGEDRNAREGVISAYEELIAKLERTEANFGGKNW